MQNVAEVQEMEVSVAGIVLAALMAFMVFMALVVADTGLPDRAVAAPTVATRASAGSSGRRRRDLGNVLSPG
jgi:hypothetical protein